MEEEKEKGRKTVEKKKPKILKEKDLLYAYMTMCTKL